MQTETQDTARTSPDEDDELLRERVGTCIAEACGGDMPDGVAVHVVDRRVTLTGRVEDIELSQRLEKAAATPPGILGVSNQLTTRSRSNSSSSSGLVRAVSWVSVCMALPFTV